MIAGGGYNIENPLRSETDRAEEAALVEGILAGNTDDFEVIIERYQARLLNLTRRHLHREDELDDALQDIFLRIYSSLPRFRGRSNLYTWIYSIASNYLIDRLRKRRHRKISDDDLHESGIELVVRGFTGGNPAMELERREEVNLIWMAMESMDPLFKNILVLREVEDLDYEELSEILGIGMGTVKSRLYRARADLKRRYLALTQAGRRKPSEKCEHTGNILTCWNMKLDGRLSGEEERRLEAHLRECKACRKEYETLAGIRRNLLSVADVPLDKETAERQKAGIMAEIRKRAESRTAWHRRSVLRPAVVLVSIIVISIISISLLNNAEPPGPVLFSDPQDVILDRMLVNTLNEHELTGIFEAFNEPALIATEMGANGNFMLEQLR